MILINFSSTLPQCGLHALRRKRNLTDANPRRIKNRVANRCGRHGHSRFTGSGCGSLGTIEQHGFDLRNFRTNGQRTVRPPVNGRYLLVVPGDFLTEGTAHAVQRASLELIFQSIGIRNRTHIIRNDEPLHGDAAGVLMNVDFRDNSAIAVVAFV